MAQSPEIDKLLRTCRGRFGLLVDAETAREASALLVRHRSPLEVRGRDIVTGSTGAVTISRDDFPPEPKPTGVRPW